MGKLRIAVNTRLLLNNKLEGIGRFTHETLSRLTTDHPEVDFFFLFDRKFDDKFVYSKNVTPVVLFPQARHPILWYLWFQFSVKQYLKNNKVDLFLSPDGFSINRSNVKTLPVIHDINFLHKPENLPYFHAKYYNYNFPKFARNAERIATVSEFSKADIVNNYNINPALIDVVYNGVNASFNPLAKEEALKVIKKYSFGSPFWFFIGSIHPRKNIINMLKAFDEYKKASNSSDKFLLAGNKKWWTREMQQTLASMKHANDVVFLGRISDQEYLKLLPSAKGLLYVSKFEGFGIPIIEAFSCETPVICSNVSSLPEIAATAAICVNPESVNDISNGMLKIHLDDKLRSKLISEGVKRAKTFTWQNTSDLLWKSIQKAIYA